MPLSLTHPPPPRNRDLARSVVMTSRRIYLYRSVKLNHRRIVSRSPRKSISVSSRSIMSSLHVRRFRVNISKVILEIGFIDLGLPERKLLSIRNVAFNDTRTAWQVRLDFSEITWPKTEAAIIAIKYFRIRYLSAVVNVATVNSVL